MRRIDVISLIFVVIGSVNWLPVGWVEFYLVGAHLRRDAAGSANTGRSPGMHTKSERRRGMYELQTILRS